MSIESRADFEALLRVGRIVARTLRVLARHARPGVTTGELDRIGADLFAHLGARSAPAMVYGFPRTVLISVNDEVVHGIPGPRRLAVGDVVKLDVTAEKDGYMADAARTVLIGPASAEARRLRACARAAFSAALAGSGEAWCDPDGWTIRTRDGSLAAHHEHTLVITRRRPLVLTAAA